jgi:hypothetical protein
MHKSLALTLALAVALPAAAADSADARARAVAPYIDDQTFAVARLDLGKADADALVTIFRALGQADPDEAPDVKRWLGDFRKAGGKELYFVFTLADAPHIPFVIAPLGEGADAKAIAGLLDFWWLEGGRREKVGDAVFSGWWAALQVVRALKPTARPELAKAFAAAGDGAAQLALIPPPHLGRVVDEMMPVLPREVGGGSSKALTRGVKWAALGLDPPPQMALRLTVQSEDADAAKALNDTVGQALRSLGGQKEVRAALPGFDKMAALIAPKVERDRLVLSLDDKAMRVVLEPLVRRAVLVAAQMESAEHLTKLADRLHAYVDANKQRMPPVANFDGQGKPLLSWRVHLLPYLGEEKLYKEFRLDEAWDSEHNKKIVARMPAVFRGPSRKLNGQGKTVYLAPVGKDVAFTGGADGRRFPNEFGDGTSNTILLVEADDAHAVEWTKPEDLKVDLDRPDAGLARHLGSFLVALADGTVRPVAATVSKKTLRAAFTTNGGETLGPDW